MTEAWRLFVDRTGRHLFASFPGGLRVYEAEGTTPIVDDDEDGIDDTVDNCPGLANPDQLNGLVCVPGPPGVRALPLRLERSRVGRR